MAEAAKPAIMPIANKSRWLRSFVSVLTVEPYGSSLAASVAIQASCPLSYGAGARFSALSIEVSSPYSTMTSRSCGTYTSRPVPRSRGIARPLLGRYFVPMLGKRKYRRFPAALSNVPELGKVTCETLMRRRGGWSCGLPGRRLLRRREWRVL
jgi:hypothetical protein